MRNATIAKLGIAFAAIFMVAGANAATYSWDFRNSLGLPATTFTDTYSSCAGTGCAASYSLTLNAYSATNGNTWAAATFFNYSGGLGITNGIVGAGQDAGAPEHAIDNIPSKTDYVIIDAGLGKVLDWSTFSIGWGYDTTGTNVCNGSDSCTPEIKLWSTSALPGTLNSSNIAGFANATVSATNSNGSSTSIPGSITSSRYLIMSGDVNDAFKLKTLTASTVQVPEPVSIALLALGLLGVGYTRRKSAN